MFSTHLMHSWRRLGCLALLAACAAGDGRDPRDLGTAVDTSTAADASGVDADVRPADDMRRPTNDGGSDALVVDQGLDMLLTTDLGVVPEPDMFAPEPDMFMADMFSDAPDLGSCSDLQVTVAAAGRGRSVDAATGANRDWSDPGEIGAADAVPSIGSLFDNVARARLSGSSEMSALLVADQFGFAIDSARTILGLEVRLLRRATRGSILDESIQLRRTGGPVGDVRGLAGVDWQDADFLTDAFGASGDGWGTSWSPSTVNTSEFGVALRVSWAGGAGNSDAMVDQIEIAVHHADCP